jgi:hypothetical protein
MKVKFREWCKVMSSEDGEFEKLSAYKKYELYQKKRIIWRFEKNNSPSNENLSERDIRELMGVNRDTYVRHKGSIRRK